MPDALSRLPNTEDLAPIEPDPERMALTLPRKNETIPTRTVPALKTIHVPSLFEDVINAQQEDPEISQQISKWLEKQNQVGLTPVEELFIQNHRLDERRFWRRSRDNKGWLLLAPKLLRQKIIWEYHDAPPSGHPGTEETLRSIHQTFIWPGVSREIRRYVAGCHLCICCKPTRGHHEDHQRPRSARTAWEAIAVDVMSPYPRTRQGNRFILVVTDMFSRWVEAFPLRDLTAPRLIEIFESNVFPRWGYPRRILSDNGTQFTGLTWAEAGRRWDCELWTTPVYHPRANPTERRNQELKNGLRLRLRPDNQRTWDQYLPQLHFGLLRRQNAATGYIPSYLLFGKTIPLPGEWRLMPLIQSLQSADQDSNRKRREEEANYHQHQYQEKYAGGPTEPRYAAGDWVLTKNHQLSNKAEGYDAA